MVRNHEVRGSIPLFSTKETGSRKTSGFMSGIFGGSNPKGRDRGGKVLGTSEQNHCVRMQL